MSLDEHAELYSTRGDPPTRDMKAGQVTSMARADPKGYFETGRRPMATAHFARSGEVKLRGRVDGLA